MNATGSRGVGFLLVVGLCGVDLVLDDEEGVGLDPGEAEDIVDVYLEEADEKAMAIMLKPGPKIGVKAVAPPQPVQEKPAPATDRPMQRKGNIRQSVSRWCYPKMTLDELCAYSAQIGLKGVDLLEPADPASASHPGPAR